MYLAIVLDDNSKKFLIQQLSLIGWETHCHHVTICMGRDKKGKYPFTIGEEVTVTIKSIGTCWAKSLPAGSNWRLGLAPDVQDDDMLVTCVEVELPEGKFIKNIIPHVTLSVNRRAGAKPVFSNACTEWAATEHEGKELKGRVSICV